MELTNLTTLIATSTPIILGLVQLIKQFGLNTKYASIISILLGILLVGLLQGFGIDSIIPGIIAGLTASGLYSGAKSVRGI